MIKRKLLNNIIIGVISFILLIVFAICDFTNRLGFFVRLKNETTLTRIVGLVIIGFIILFIASLFMGILFYNEDEKKQYKAYDFLNTCNIIPITISIFLLIDAFFFSPVIVKGRSMEETLHNGDCLITSHLNNNYINGDIVIIQKEDGTLLIKRVVAIEGDTLTVSVDGEVIVNDEIIENHHVPSKTYDNYTLKEGEYYCLGDNRGNSTDSRVYGVFTDEMLCGKVIFSIKPWNNDLNKR